MPNENDVKILALKEKIAEKKAKLEKLKKFAPLTNCMLDIDNNPTRINIQVLDKEHLIQLMAKLGSYSNAALKLGIGEQLFYSGFHVSDWIEDLKQRLDILNRKEEETNLKALENKLQALLSADTKAAMEIDEIEKLLQ